MFTMILLTLKIIFYLVILIVIFNLFMKLIDNNNKPSRIIANSFKNLFNNIRKAYEYLRQHFCKKSNEVNDDSGTVRNNTEIYDSSSVWED